MNHNNRRKLLASIGALSLFPLQKFNALTKKKNVISCAPETSVQKVNELISEIKHLAHDYINDLDHLHNNPDHNSELLYNISQCVSTLNSYNRFKMLTEMNDDINTEPPLVFTMRKKSEKKSEKKHITESCDV